MAVKNYVITIARGFGSGGLATGMELSRRLGIPCYERQLLYMAAERSGIRKDEFIRSDEKLKGGYLMNMLRKIPFNGIAEPTKYGFVSDEDLFYIQSEIIKELARTESCIIIGKCANVILQDFDNVVSVYIEAPRKQCLESVMEKYSVDKSTAKDMIEKTDKYRSDYYRYYTGGMDWTNPTSYDMTLNSGRVGRKNCATMIERYLEVRFGEDYKGKKK